MEKLIEGKITDRQLMMFADGELTKEEREKENLVKEIERALQTLVSNDICNLPMPTPEEIQSKKELCKIILDELNKADESKKK